MSAWGRSLARGALLVALLTLTLASVGLLAAPAHAAPRHSKDGGDTLTLAITNGTSFPYGGNYQPYFEVTLTLGAPIPNTTLQVHVNLENGQSYVGYGNTSSSTTVQIAVSASYPPTPTIGAHTAIASFHNPSTLQDSQSNPVSFTITEATPELSCSISNYSAIFSPGEILHIAMIYTTPMSGPPADWQDGTYVISFEGPTTVISPSLAPDGADTVTVPAPTQVGVYTKLDCAFSGTATFTGVTASNTEPMLVSEQHQLGGVKVYTDPTTMIATQSTQVYVVFEPAPGLPTPGGMFNFVAGYDSYTKEIQVGANGATLVTLAPIANLKPTDSIEIQYDGDPYYGLQNVSFPVANNPPIPTSGGGNGGGSGGGGKPTQPKATATPHATATATAAATATASSSAIASGAQTNVPGVAAPKPHAAPSLLALFTPLSWSNGALWLAALIVLLALGSGAGTFIMLGRRGAQSSVADGGAPEPVWPPTHSPLDEDTQPQRSIDDE